MSYSIVPMTAQNFDVSRIINEAREDPDLFSKIDVNALLDSLESTQNDFLEGCTIDSVAENVFYSLKQLEFAKYSGGKAEEGMRGLTAPYLTPVSRQSGNTQVEDLISECASQVNVDNALLAEHCRKLVGYRYVDELHVLHKGKYVRWIRKDTPTPQLMAGGIVVDVKFGDAGVNVLVRTTSGRFTQYRFDKCLTYQKLTDEEQLILMLYERVD